MSYIGNQPFNASFITDTFSGTGVQTAYTLTVGPGSGNAILVVISGVLQPPSAYSVVGQILTFTSAPPAGTNNIVVRYLSLPASSVTTSAFRNITEITATAGQTTFIPASYTPGFVEVFRNGVRLNSADFTSTNGTTVVLVNPAYSGDTVTIVGFYVSSVLNAIPNSPGSVNISNLDISNQGGTGAIQIPVGSTGQRPSSPSVGMQRWNNSINAMEVYLSTNVWQAITQTSVAVNYLIVAGGGGGGGAGGGGGGGVLASANLVLSAGTTYPVVVGAAGTGAQSSVRGGNGGNSTFNGLTAIGGGGGGNYGTSDTDGAAGGSGGGAGHNTGSTTSGGAGTNGQGFKGGDKTTFYGNNPYSSAGGGGAGSVGLNPTANNVSGAGGPGLLNSITGSNLYWAGGGGGGQQGSGTAGNGGIGGGGGGCGFWSGQGTNGTGGTSALNPGTAGFGNGSSTSTGGSGGANTGGGGGGMAISVNFGGPGGSGIVIISYPGSNLRASGGIVTQSGNYIIHSFYTSGNFITY